MGAALLKGLLTSSFAGLPVDRGLGLLPSCAGKETWVGSLTGRLVTGSRDGTASVWDLAARQASLILAPSGGGWATPRRDLARIR
jgi:hypothetical protein